MGTAEAKSVPDLQMWRLEPLISFLRLAMPLYAVRAAKRYSMNSSAFYCILNSRPICDPNCRNVGHNTSHWQRFCEEIEK